MNAARKYHQSWEALNEKRIHSLFENLLVIAKSLGEKTLAVLNVTAFVVYKLIKITGLIARVIFSENTIVRIEREESWIFRSLK